MAMKIREAMKKAESGDVWVRNDTEGSFVLFVLSNYSDSPYRAIFFSPGRVAIIGNPGKEAIKLAGLQKATSKQKDRVLDLLYDAEIESEQ